MLDLSCLSFNLMKFFFHRQNSSVKFLIKFQSCQRLMYSQKKINEYRDMRKFFKIYMKMKLWKNSPQAGSSRVSHKKKRRHNVSFFMFVCLCTQYDRFFRFVAFVLVTREYLLARLVGLKAISVHTDAFISRFVGLF